VGAHIHDVLDQKLERIQLTMEAELGQTSLEKVVADAESQMKD
ncbi:TPA: Rrf2 family transcriptional regulator, partial [Streptococcus pneumoniae]